MTVSRSPAYGVEAMGRGGDVITTGATMSAAASALKAAGASRVDGLAFARVWG